MNKETCRPFSDCSNQSDWKKRIPEVVYPARPELFALYERAWELAHDHIVDCPGMPQTPYMDEAFCNTLIWIWDTCFMSMFCKYSQSDFPGVESLYNFYAAIHEKKNLATVLPENPPSWSGAREGQPIEMSICILDNPPLFAWAEYQNAMFSGDKKHLTDLLLDKRFLQKHFELLESMTESVSHQGTLVKNFWRKHRDGYFWEGGASGMDNTPRGRKVIPAESERPRNPDMLWVDAIAQQGMSAYFIAEIAEAIGKPELAQEWRRCYEGICEKVNALYWDETDGCYFDISASTHEKMKVYTLASFWPLLAKMARPEQADRLCALLEDSEKFGGNVSLPTLARDDADFKPNGAYWRGGVWVPTAYMVIKGLDQYGKHSLARTLSLSLLTHMQKTYELYSPHTIWECYHPIRSEPGRTTDDIGIVRPDFCGWSAVAPICLLIENVVGLHTVSALSNTVEWYLETDEIIGIRGLRFGDVVTDLISEGNTVAITSNKDYLLKINSESYQVHTGGQVIQRIR